MHIYASIISTHRFAAAGIQTAPYCQSFACRSWTAPLGALTGCSPPALHLQTSGIAAVHPGEQAAQINKRLLAIFRRRAEWPTTPAARVAAPPLSLTEPRQ